MQAGPRGGNPDPRPMEDRVTLLTDLFIPALPPIMGALAALGVRRVLAGDPATSTSTPTLARVAVRLGALAITIRWSTTP